MRTRISLLTPLVIMLTFGLAASDTPFELRTVVATGERAPGGGSFDRFNVETLPVVAPVNAAKDVAFFASIVRGPGAEGFFVARRGRFLKVALEGERAPGGGTFSGFARHPIPALSEGGHVAFAAAVSGGRTVEGIFIWDTGRLQAAVLSGQPVPEMSAATFATLEAPAINARGALAFLGGVRRGRESLEGVYLSEAGRLRKVVAQGDPAPAGGSFAAFGPPVLNERGAVGFAAVVEGRTVPGGLFVADGTGIRMRVAAGDETPLGGIYAKFAERLAMNDAGDLAFHALLKGIPTTAAVFVTAKGKVRSVAALGDPAPGGGVFTSFGLGPAIDAAGRVAFVAAVEGGSGSVAVFVASDEGLRRAAGVGDALAGRPIASLGLHPGVAMARDATLSFAVFPGDGSDRALIATARAR